MLACDTERLNAGHAHSLVLGIPGSYLVHKTAVLGADTSSFRAIASSTRPDADLDRAAQLCSGQPNT